MTIHFGLQWDDAVCPLPQQATGDEAWIGPSGLLHLLEAAFGMGGHSSDNEYLRIGQYRQALTEHLEAAATAFFKASFEADQFATAIELLQRRDELLQSGWNFEAHPGIPERLACLAAIEQRIQELSDFLPGIADRFKAVLTTIGKRRHAISKIVLNEPFDFLPLVYRRLLAKLQENGVTLESIQPAVVSEEDTDLAVLQRALAGQSIERSPARGDGSLLLLRGKRDSDLAVFTAKLLRQNTAFWPACLIPDKSRLLEDALMREGQPAMGIVSASAARPTLQVLKLVTVFLWNPINPFKVMEFVSLAVKPLEEELANAIAALMAEMPGMLSDSWNYTIGRYFEELENRAQADSSIRIGEIRRQYRFWFERRRYDVHQTVPIEEVIELFDYLHLWAHQSFDAGGNRNTSFIVLGEQAKRIRDLLRALPEKQLTHLELERVVRTVYEPAPARLVEQERDALIYCHQSAALAEPVEQLLWWNFTQREAVHFFSRWYPVERDYLATKNIHLDTPQDENRLTVWQRQRPFLLAQRQLVLAIPESSEGQALMAHPLLGDIEAAFGKLDPLIFDTDTFKGGPLASLFELPQRQAARLRRLGKPKPFLEIASAHRLQRRDEENFSSLETLLYYPYQWVFRHKIKLRKSSILSIVKPNTLMGNLAHRLFERLLKLEIEALSKSELERWVEKEIVGLLAKEGAVLLLYGMEPERAGFVRKLKYASWSLVSLIRENGWKVLATEKPLEAGFLGIQLNGRADVVLEKDGQLAVIDLKWRGARYREQSIRNEEDLQLALYAHLITNDENRAHTAYFIIENGRMIARNNEGFKNVPAVVPGSDHVEVHERMMKLMEATYEWRMAQIAQGRIEIRCTQTRLDLEDVYGDTLLDLLEMKQEDAMFDDYRVLVNLVE
ncbi:MAG: PD-(D/E)XK nuclease family protein [Saprospiraceae bacterium]|nr:PD-(D/E)XK nuclease family protein [Saprospiraceae bacterium]MDZ4706356.1 PD-(D/E)XK nuclease family protein [Saprospiraceae bacterium]